MMTKDSSAMDIDTVLCKAPMPVLFSIKAVKNMFLSC
jgi:hypothetical protein